MFALSTSWNTAASRSGKQIIDEIRDLGFDYVELCFSHTQREVSQFYIDQGIRVISLHNFCPIPDGLNRKKALPDCFSLSSPNKAERTTAVKYTKRTILTAEKLKAKAVVLHTGRVEIPDQTRKLISLRLKKKTECCEFESLKLLALSQREANKEVYLESAFKSIKELSGFAFDLGISLGIENRFYISEIPNFNETKLFLDNFHKKGVFYWHDTGHAYVFEKLGLTKHLDYLKAYSKYLLGIHLHDVGGFQDHMAPFCGEIDFRQFRPFVKKETLKIIEAHKPTTANQIIAARNRLERLFN